MNAARKSNPDHLTKALVTKVIPKALGLTGVIASSLLGSASTLKDKFSKSDFGEEMAGMAGTPKKLQAMLWKSGSGNSKDAEADVLITGSDRGKRHGHAAVGIPGKGLLNLGTSEAGFNFGEK